MKKVIVLGAGMVGTTMAIDLANSYAVTVADRSVDALDRLKKRMPGITVEALDVTDKDALGRILASFDLVVNAVPGFLGYRTLEQIILSGKSVVDISFFPEDALALEDLARQKGVTAVVDCGVAPGMDNIILGYYDTQLKVTDFLCLVGGLPKQKKWPFAYKAPFSPIDVIEEYTRPARYVEHGEVVVRPALTDCEFFEFDGVGTLEAFNSDGLRSLISTMPHIPYMKEKTLRYPGHVEYIQVLKESGFFSEDTIAMGNCEIRPLDVTSKILFKEWFLHPDEEELTVMRVQVKGLDANGSTREIIYDMLDYYCSETGASSMSRTTGYTATAVANLVLNGKVKKKGILPPEYIGQEPGAFEFILKYLKDRNVVYRMTEREL